MINTDSDKQHARSSGFGVLFVMALALPAVSMLPADLLRPLAAQMPLQALFETISVAAAFAVFVVAWLSYQRRAPMAVVLIALTFLAVTLFGLGYLLAEQHAVVSGTLVGTETAQLLWSAARLFAALGVTLVVVVPWKTEPIAPATRLALLSASLALVGGVYAVVLLAHREVLAAIGSAGGMAAFRDVVHYFATGLYAVNAAVLWFYRRAIPNTDNRSLLTAILFIILASICFGLQGGVDGTFNILGQVYKLFAYYYLFRAVVISGIETPQVELASARSRLEATLDTLPDIVLELDREGTIHQVHSRFPDLLAQSEAAAGQNLFECLPGEAGGCIRRLIDDVDRNGRSSPHQCRLAIEGKLRDFEAVGNSLKDPRTLSPHYIVLIQDISRRKRLDHELRIAAAAFESQESICITDEHHRILRVNSAFTRITGFSEQEVAGEDPALLLPEDDREAFRHKVDERLEHRSRWRGEIRLRDKSGEVHSQLLLVTPVRGDRGNVRNYIYDYIDISALKKAETRIQQLALYDALTGLGNRRLMEQRLTDTIEQSRQDDRFAGLLLINLIQFKKVNDALGFGAGDQLLIQVAQELRAIAGHNGDAFRQGADEFALIVEPSARDAKAAAGLARAVADRVFSALNRAFILDGNEFYNRCRIGATVFAGADIEAPEVLGQAAIALHQLKSEPERIFSFFDPEMQQTVAHEQTLESELRKGIAEDQFVLHYQPKVDRRRRIVGLEALIRWNHPERGLLHPGEFIPAAERSGLITPIEKWTLEKAIAQLAEWHGDGPRRKWSISVNVASSQFYREEFEPQLVAMLERYRIDADHLILEFTESTLLDDVYAAREKIRRLADRGVRFSIDDFGTGYSSLAYLGRLPVHELKIDRSFVHDLDREAYNAAIVRMVIEMAHILGIQVVAEGVETEAQYRFLAEQGCDLLQGFLFGRPMPVEDIEQHPELPRLRQ